MILGRESRKPWECRITNRHLQFWKGIYNSLEAWHGPLHWHSYILKHTSEPYEALLQQTAAVLPYYALSVWGRGGNNLYMARWWWHCWSVGHTLPETVTSSVQVSQATGKEDIYFMKQFHYRWLINGARTTGYKNADIFRKTEPYLASCTKISPRSSEVWAWKANCHAYILILVTKSPFQTKEKRDI